MPKCFFDVQYRDHIVIHDLAGCELPDLDSARIEGVEIWKRCCGSRAAGGAVGWSVQIRDAAGLVLAEVPDDAVPFNTLRRDAA